MLTIKPTISFNSIHKIQSLGEDFGERIRGNYLLMQVNLSPKDLLHFVTSPAEIYMETEGITSLYIENKIINSQDIKLEIINNLLNRILIAEENRLSYQDRVYISSVLNQLGITDVTLFLKEVKALKKENQNIYQLVKLYWEHGEAVHQVLKSLREEETPVLNLKTDDRTESKEGIRYFLHQEIYERLNTSVIYDLISNLYQNIPSPNNFINRVGLNLSEQNRIAKTLFLTDLKKEVTLEEDLSLNQHRNIYEYIDADIREITEEKVFSSVSSAVLLNLVDNLFLCRIEQFINKKVSWFHTEEALYLAAQNVMKRFEENYKEGKSISYEANSISTELNQLLAQEAGLLQTFAKDYWLIYNPVIQELQNSKNYIQEMNLTYKKEEGDSNDTVVTEENKKEHKESFYTQDIQNITRQVLESGKKAKKQEISKEILELQKRMERENWLDTKWMEYKNLFQEILRISHTEKFLLEQKSIQFHVISTDTNPVRNQEMKQLGSHVSLADGGLNLTIEQNTVDNSLTYKAEESYKQEETTDNNYSIQSVKEFKELKEQLDYINEQNVIRKQKYESMEINQQAAANIFKDIKKLKKDALRALSHPEEVLQEVLQTPAPLELKTNYAIKNVLNLLDENTRNFYETVLKFDKGQILPETAGAIKKGSQGELLSALRQQQREEVQLLPLVHEMQAEVLKEYMDNVLEPWKENPAVIDNLLEEEIQKPQGLQFIYKQANNVLTEEVMEELLTRQNIRSENTVITENISNRENYVQTNMHQLKEEIVTKTTEDLTELIDRGVQKQIGLISEKVLSKLEKKLQNERARRGY